MKLWITALASVLALAAVADELKIDSSMLKKEIGNIDYIMELDGENSIVINGVGPAPRQKDMKNRYISGSIRLSQPVDMTNKTLKLKLRSDHYKELTGLYVRAYNAGSSKPAMSWMNFKPMLILQKEFREFTLGAGHLPGGLQWQSSVLEKNPPTSIDRIQFLTCSHSDQEINLFVRDIEFESGSILQGTKDFWKEVGTYKGRAPSNFTVSPAIECDFEDGMYEMKLSGHSTMNAVKGKNWYEAAAFSFAEPIPFRNKTLSFQIQRDSDVQMIFIRGYNDKTPKKHAEFSYYVFGKKIPVDTWVPVVLGSSVFKADNAVKVLGNPETINRIEVIYSTVKPNEDFSVELRDMKVVDFPAAQ